MPTWGWIAVAYGMGMAALALFGYAHRRFTAIVASILFALGAANLAVIENVPAQVVLPAMATLVGYWLSGLFVGVPQPRLEQSLLAFDRRLLRRLRIDEKLQQAPVWVLNAIEFVYSTVYIVVVAGALLTVPFGLAALLRYWAVVLAAELVCCAALPFLRCRPPRSVDAPGVIARRRPVMRRLNDLLVNHGSIQANTLPSAHVAASLAAGLAVLSWHPSAGAALIGCAVLIAGAATVGRYHYAIDCLLGAVVAVGVWAIT